MSAATEAADLPALEADSLSERMARSYGWFVIAVATVIAYANTFTAPFVFDGTNYIVENADLRDLSQPEKILSFSPTRAVGYFTFALNYALAKELSANDDGYDPRSWHVVNLSIHIFAAWTLWGLARRGLQSPKLGGRFAGASEQLALTIALIWAVHPLCTQAVTYLYQRVEALMGLFMLLTIYCTARFAALQESTAAADADRLPDDDRRDADDPRRSADDGPPLQPPRFVIGLVIWPLLALVFCLAGMATKETMLVAPLVTIWYDRVFLARSWGELFSRRAFLHLGLLGTWALLIPLMVGTQYDAAGINDHRHDTRISYFLNQTRVILHYFRLVFIPWGQNLDYHWQRAAPLDIYKPPNDEYVWQVFLATRYSLAALSALGLATLVAVVRRPAIGFLGAAVFLTLAPTSSFFVIIDLCFEHRMYVPLMAAVALVVVLVYEALELVRRVFDCDPENISTARISLAWLTVAVLIALTLRRNNDYRSHIAIWADAEAKARHNDRAAYNHGVFLQNDTAPGSLDQALRQYQRTLELNSRYDGAHLNLANVYAWKATLELDPAKREVLLRDAEHHYRKLVELLPADERGLYGLADVLRQQRRWNEAEEVVDQLLAKNPNHEQAPRLKADIARERARASATPTAD